MEIYTMTRIIAAALVATSLTAIAVPASAQTATDQRRWENAQRRYDNETRIYETERRRYEDSRRYSGYDDRYGDDRGRYDTEYDAARYYRDDSRYQERRLSANDEVYRGSDGRYYCKRTDGTTGLIIGGAAGGILGNVLAGGRRGATGTLVGGALGALLGRSVERSEEFRCR